MSVCDGRLPFAATTKGKDEQQSEMCWRGDRLRFRGRNAVRPWRRTETHRGPTESSPHASASACPNPSAKNNAYARAGNNAHASARSTSDTYR